MTRHVFLFAVLATFFAAPAVAQQAPLRPAPGRDLVEAACSVCHSLSYIPMNARFLSSEVWTAEVAKMRTAFGAPIDDDAAKVIAAYLISEYGPAPAK